MNDPLRLRRILEAPAAFWGALALGVLALIAMFVGQSLVVGAEADAQAARSAQLESQAAEAGARQKQAAEVERARRTDLMS